MRSAFKSRVRSSSISAVAPTPLSPNYNPQMAKAASSILYRSPISSPSGHPIYILNATALPDTHEVDYDTLLPYVLARLPDEEDLIKGSEYEVVFFAGGATEGATSTKKNRPGVGWFIQAYHVLSRAMRKRIQRLYIVQERTWVRVLVEVFSTIISPKFKKKIVHASTLSSLAQHIAIENILIPPSAYLRDRQLSPNIHVANASGRRAFSSRTPLPKSFDGTSRLPRVLRETTAFILLNLQTEGIFRIPAHIKLKEILREAYDRGQKYIVWKERDVWLPLPKYENAADINAIVKDIDQTEAYGVHLAASLLKFWYSELREPVFPATRYKELNALFGNTEEVITSERLVELLSPKSEWSIIPQISRDIVTRHLLPLLAEVAAHSYENKMTPENLAVCFAPILCCGPDQLADAKASGVLRRLLTATIEMWPTGLREACGVDEASFAKDLQAPPRLEDYEDPIPIGSSGEEDEKPERPTSAGVTGEQEVGILLQDNDVREQIVPPPLPPRQPAPVVSESISELNHLHSTPQMLPRTSAMPGSEDTVIRRKEVPHVNTSLPPRYSTALASTHDDVTESPSTYMTPANGFAPHKRGDWSFEMSESGSSVEGLQRQDSQIKRKPVGGTSTPIGDGKE